MKRIWSILLLVSLLFCLSACSDTLEPEEPALEPQDIDAAELEEIDEKEEWEEESEAAQEGSSEQSNTQSSEFSVPEASQSESLPASDASPAGQTEEENSGEVEFALTQSTFSYAPQYVEGTITNHTNERRHKDRRAVLQRYDGTGWTTLPIDDMSHDVYEYLETGETDTWFFALSPDENRYSAGRYRVYLTGFDLSAEFNIGQLTGYVDFSVTQSRYTEVPERIDVTITNNTNGQIALAGTPAIRQLELLTWLPAISITAESFDGTLEPGEMRTVSFQLNSDQHEYAFSRYMIQIPEMGLVTFFDIR